MRKLVELSDIQLSFIRGVVEGRIQRGEADSDAGPSRVLPDFAIDLLNTLREADARPHDDTEKIINGLRASLAVATQATTCARCGVFKHTPWRDGDGYICAGCLGKERDELADQLMAAKAAISHLQDDEMTNLRDMFDQAQVELETLRSQPPCTGVYHCPGCRGWAIPEKTAHALAAAERARDVAETATAAAKRHALECSQALETAQAQLREERSSSAKHAELLARELRVTHSEKNHLERERDEWRSKADEWRTKALDVVQELLDARDEWKKKAEGALKSSGLEAARERIDELLNDKDRLLDAIDKDATGLAAALGHIKHAIDRRSWVSESRGAYSWDDDKYKEETYHAFKEVTDILGPALQKSGTIANKAWVEFEGGRILKLGAEVRRLRAALADLGQRDHRDYGAPCAIIPVSQPLRRDHFKCTCGADEHNAKLAATLEAQP